MSGRPWRRCPACQGVCHWVEPAWRCERCRREWQRDTDTRFAPPGARQLDLATCSYSEYRDDMGLGVRISLGSSRWTRRDQPWPYIPDLAPRRAYPDADEPVFLDRYLAQLRGIGSGRIRQALEEVAVRHHTDRLVLLCFERLDAGQLCHRRYFASWWYTTTGEPVPELGRQLTYEQLSLSLEGPS